MLIYLKMLIIPQNSNYTSRHMVLIYIKSNIGEASEFNYGVVISAKTFPQITTICWKVLALMITP